MSNDQEMSNNQSSAAEATYPLCITCQYKTVKPPNQLCSQCIFHIPQPAPKSLQPAAAAPAPRAPEKPKPAPFVFRDAVGPLTPEFVSPNRKGDVLMLPGRLPYFYK